MLILLYSVMSDIFEGDKIFDVKYKDGKIYILICNKTGKRYYGSTILTLTKRLLGHENPTNNCASKEIIDEGDYEMFLIENYPCNSKWELEEQEGYYIRNNYNYCVNIAIPHQTREEWYLLNNNYTKQYYIDNAEKRKEYQKQYRLNKKITKQQI